MQWEHENMASVCTNVIPMTRTQPYSRASWARCETRRRESESVDCRCLAVVQNGLTKMGDEGDSGAGSPRSIAFALSSSMDS